MALGIDNKLRIGDLSSPGCCGVLESRAISMYEFFYSEHIEEGCAKKIARPIEDCTWEELETFKRDNPVWCSLHENDCGDVRDALRPRVKWSSVGVMRPHNPNPEDLLDKLMQTHFKRSERVLKSVVCANYSCTKLPAKYIFKAQTSEYHWAHRLPVDYYSLHNHAVSRRKLPDPWRAYHPSRLIEYLEKAEGEAHDAAVYDTGYEFDPANQLAVRYVAWVAMSKAFPLWSMTEVRRNDAGKYLDSYQTDMPTDGSVAPASEEPSFPAVKHHWEQRKQHESSFFDKYNMVYIPSSREYVGLVLEACHNYDVGKDSLLKTEKLSQLLLLLIKRLAQTVKHIPALMIVVGGVLCVGWLLSYVGLMPSQSFILWLWLRGPEKMLLIFASITIYGILLKTYTKHKEWSIGIGIAYTLLLIDIIAVALFR